jgi:DNA-binding beta-propeller fold protein YncE
MGVISRVAGTGTRGDSGDDGPATAAQLNIPVGVAVIPGGGFLIADTGNNVVRMVSPAGVITRVAGTGTPGDIGDDGPAAAAQLNEPTGVAVTPDGGFLIADAGNHVVRMVSPAGVITRVAGTGTSGDRGDDGRATAAQLNDPEDVAVIPAGGFLIADAGEQYGAQGVTGGRDHPRRGDRHAR